MSAIWHGVAGIDAEVEENLMELGGVAFNGGELCFVLVMNGDIFWKSGLDNSCEFFE